MYSYLYTLCLSLLLLPSLVALGTPETSGRPEEASTPPLDCSDFETFLSSGEFTLSYTATLGTECVTISTQLNFGADYTLEEVASDGTVLNGYTYAITAVDDQCALASAEDDCGVQLLAFNGDNSALTLTADGGEATLTPVPENTDDWGIWQSYVILNDGVNDIYMAGGLNPDATHPSFEGADFGTLSTDGSTLILNGGEIKTYKNNAANVCGGNLQYRVYQSGVQPGSFSGVDLAFNTNLGNGDQKWSTTNAGIDLLSGLTPGDYTLEVYWDADGDTFGSCGSTNYENNNGGNYTASFSLITAVSGCTDPDYAEYDASATTDDSSCATLLSVTNENTSAKYATIQAGIDAASAGDVLSLAATTFNPTGTINVDKSLTISGAGSGSTTIDIGGYNAWGIYITADNVTLSGVTIQGDASVNEAYALKAGSGNNTGGSPSICQNLAYSDIIIQGTKRTAIDINGVNGATLTNITATGATGGFGMSISSSANVAVTNLTTSGNAWGDVGIFPANTAYQWPSLEGPAGITFDGTLDLSSGQGSISVQDGALASGGTWVGSISIDAADNADVTVPNNFDVRLDAVRSDGLAFHVVTNGGAAEPTLNALLGATSPFSYSDITLQNLLTDEWAVSAGMELQATIDAADAGDTIELDGALSASETINVNKSINMYGGGSGTTTIATSSAGYGMSISADNVSLSGFTLDGSGTFGVKASGVSNFSLNDVEATNGGNSAIDLNGVNGATLTNISASNTALGYGLAIASSSDVTINGITTSSNTYGAVGIFPAQTQYQDAGLEAPSNIVIGGTVSLNSGAGAITVQNGALNSGGTWVGTVSNDAADNADVTVPADFTHALYSTRNDGITGQSVAAQAVIQGLVAYGAANPVPGIEYSDVYIYDMDNGDYEVIEPLLIQDAIDAAETGDLINVLAGTYVLENEIVVNKALTISGSSRDDVILDGSGSSDSYGFSIQSDNVTLSGMTVNGGGLAGPIVFGIHVRPDFSGFTATGMSANNCQQNGIGLTGINGDNGANTISDFVATGNGLYSIGIGSSEDVTVSNVSGGNIGLYLSSASTSQTMSNVVFQEPMTLTGGFVIEKTTTAQKITYSTSDGTDADYNASAGVVVPTDFDQAFHSSLEDVPLYGTIGDVDLVSLVTETALPFFISATTGGTYTASGLAVRDLSEGRWEITNDLSIQDAIDIAESGDNIWIADDTHTITSTIDVNKGLTIEGESMAGAILDASGMTPLTNRVIETDADNITLRNLTIKPITDPDPVANNSIGFTIKAGANSTPTINDGLVMENITIDGAAERTPFDFHGLDNVTLTNLNASGTTRGNGMQLTGCTNVTLNSFTGTANAWGGIAVYASRYVPSAGRGSDNISIVGSGLSIDGAVFSQDDIDPANGDLLNTNVSVTGWDFLVYNDAFRGGANDSEEYTFYAEDETAAVTLALGLNTGNTASSAQQISTSDWIVANGMAIAPALSDAAADQNVEVRAGTYEEDLAFDKELNINGPNSGIAHDGSRGAEAIIDGEHTLSATGAVMLDGLQFLSNNPAETSTIYITTAAGHTIQNNQFVSSIAGGGTGGQNDMALYTSVLSSGSMTIAENSFSGDGTFSDGERYSSAAWGRGLWFNGGGAAVTVSNNAFANCRTGMNLENYDNSTCSIENNSFVDCGTGMSLGVPTAGDITSITNNSFQDVDTDINARNLTGNLNWDLDATGNSALPGNSTYYSDLGAIPGNSSGDIDDPNGNLAYLSGNGEDRLIFGGEDNTVTGDYTAAANDYLDGGGGTNYAQYGDAASDLTLSAFGDTLYVQSPTAGNDTLLNFGFLILSDGPLAVILGCTDSGADNYDVTATVDNLTCEIQGCTTPGACNFDTSANTDDGSCEFTSCAGCRDEGACNYDPAATLDGPAGTCTYPATYYVDCDGNCLDGFDLDNNGTCDPEDVVGCMNANASNYNVFATVPDGSCAFEIVGCIQPDACNYNSDATIADVTSTCIFPSETYLNCQGACVNDSDGDGVCDEIEVAGCTDSGADNYNAAATDDDGSCITSSAPGCLIPSATNYDPNVTVQGQPVTSFCTFNFITPPMIAPPGVDCADSNACNYDNTASGYSECEYSSCLGCTIPSACNYDDTAIYNDGSCEYTSCTGCTTSGACNYDDTATINDGSCEYTSCAGCTEPNANNYDASATNDDGSCEYLGCTNASACNYGCTDVAACTAAGVSGPNTDDGSCEFTSCAGCQDSGACNYDATATIAGSCEFTSCAGCTDNTADNHDAGATIDDGSCAFGGCTNGSACNYDASANVDDGSCTYPASGFDCNGDCLDLNNNSICDNAETPVPGCTNPNACNYDASATQNDGSCTVVTASASDITVELDANGVASIAPSDVLASEANLIGHWTFEAGQEATDLTGNWGDLNVVPGDLVGGSLDLDPGDYYATSGYTGNTISEKTLMAWVQIEDLAVVSGSPISLNDNSGNFFDGIVYAERQANRFMSGSDNFNRTDDFTPGFEETLTGTFVNIAITYVDEGGSTRVTGYRNGVQIGTYAQGTLQTWTNGNARIQFGPRHYTSNGNVDMLVEEARIYDRALTGPEIEEIIAGECTIASSTVAPNTFDVDDLGPNNAVLTVTDDQGNSDTDGFVVTVEDNIPPVASANDITLEMTSTSQEVILTALQVSTSTDNAGIESQTLSQNSFFGCDDVKTHLVTLTVVDYAGNSDYVTFNVTITHPDVDSDGICDDQDNCTDLTANNYNDPANGVCQPCGTAPVFTGVAVTSAAQNMTEANGVVYLDITSGTPITLQLTGINGTADYSATIPTEMGTIPAGYYEARIIDADGCLGVADAPGGSTFGQPSVMYPLVMPYTQCCSGCGIYDADTDGICDDSDNCINKLAPNYNDPANEDCIISGCTNPNYTEYNPAATVDDGSCETFND